MSRASYAEPQEEEGTVSHNHMEAPSHFNKKPNQVRGAAGERRGQADTEARETIGRASFSVRRDEKDSRGCNYQSTLSCT